MKQNLMIAFALLPLAAGTLAQSAGAWTGLGVFDGRNANVEWRAPDGGAIKAQSNLHAGEAGLRMNLPLSRVSERFYRDATIRMDLSAFTEFSLSIRITDPGAVSRCSLYFKSGGGWYGGWFTVGGAQWQTVNIARAAFGVEGTPAGWSRIEAVRIAFWKASDTDTRAEITALRGRASPIAILKNSRAIATMPAERTMIERSAERLRLWFESAGLHAAVLDDESLAQDGAPPGCRLMILPFNPEIPPATAKALETFTGKGGRLIVMYELPPKLAPLLGLGGKRWMKADPPDALASIRFSEGVISGLPPVIRQDSWNANIPEPDAARVIGVWANGAGAVSGFPAVTLGPGGAFVGHVLTNVDRTSKMRMLMALATALAPDLLPLFSGNLRDQAVRMFGFTDWPQTRAFIEQTAKRHGRHRRIQGLLAEIDRHPDVAAPGGEKAGLGAVLADTDALRRQVRQAYFEAVGPPAKSRELRGVWCHNAAGIPGQSWPQTARDIRLAGLNALFANHQWAGVAYYPSEILPVSPLVNVQGDLLRQALDACRREGVAFHLWSVFWVLENAPEAFVAEMDKAGRLMRNRHGKTVKWLCPANSLNVDLAVNAAVEAVRRYEVDGFHLDYIRYPDNDSCYCANCAARFRRDAGRAAAVWPGDVIGGADREAFLEWRRRQITATVARIRREVKAVRPGVQVSAAVWAGWPGVRDSVGQDWAAWCRDGLLDFVCPMNYVTTATEAVTLFTGQRRATGSAVPAYPGIAPTTHHLPPEETVRQVDSLRQAGARGFVIFELDQDLRQTHLPALRAGATSE